MRGATKASPDEMDRHRKVRTDFPQNGKTATTVGRDSDGSSVLGSGDLAEFRFARRAVLRDRGRSGRSRKEHIAPMPVMCFGTPFDQRSGVAAGGQRVREASESIARFTPASRRCHSETRGGEGCLRAGDPNRGIRA